MSLLNNMTKRNGWGALSCENGGDFENIDKNELNKRLKFAEEMLESTLLDKSHLEIEINKIKESAIETIVEKEHIILQYKNQVAELEAKLAEHVEEKLSFDREKQEMKNKIIDMARMVESDAKANEMRGQELEHLINKGVEEKLTEEMKSLRAMEKELRERCREMEEKIKSLETENNQLEDQSQRLEYRHKKEMERVSIKFNEITVVTHPEEEITKLTNRFEKQIAELKKNSEAQYLDLQAEKFEIELKKMELQKRLETKDKDLIAQKEKTQNLAERLQDKEELLLEKNWMLIEMKQCFEDKINDIERNYSREKKELICKLSDLKHEKTINSPPSTQTRVWTSLSDELQNLDDIKEINSPLSKGREAEGLDPVLATPKCIEKASSFNTDSIREITPVRKLSEKTGQFKSLEILHSIAKKKITRLESEVKDLKSTLTIVPSAFSAENDRVRPLLITKDLERILKEKNKLLEKLQTRIVELQSLNKPDTDSNKNEYEELKAKLRTKGDFIEGAVLEIKERLKSGEEVTDKEIDSLYDNIHKAYSEADRRISRELDKELSNRNWSLLKTLFDEENLSSNEIEKLRLDVLSFLKNDLKDVNIENLKKECFVRHFDHSLHKHKSIFSDLLSNKNGDNEQVKKIREEILNFLKNEYNSQEISIIKASLLEELLKEEVKHSRAKDLLEILLSNQTEPRLANISKTLLKYIEESKDEAMGKLREGILRDLLIKDFSQKLTQIFSGDHDPQEQLSNLREEILKIFSQCGSDLEMDSLRKRLLAKKAQYDGNQITFEEETKTDEDLISREKELEARIEDLKKENSKLMNDIEKLKEKGRKATKPVPLLFAKTLVKL